MALGSVQPQLIGKIGYPGDVTKQGSAFVLHFAHKSGLLQLELMLLEQEHSPQKHEVLDLPVCQVEDALQQTITSYRALS